MASVYKRKSDRRDRTKPYYIAYTDECGARRVAKGCPDYGASVEISRQLDADVALRRRGVIDTALERFAEHGRLPIVKHVAAFILQIEANNRAVRYVQQLRSRLDAFVGFAEIVTIADIDADRVTAFSLSLRSRKLSDVTVNEYVGTLKEFTRWLVLTGRLPRDPLASVKKTEAKNVEKTRPRRASTVEEIGALLDAAARRPALELVTVRRGRNVGKPVAKVRPDVLTRAEAKGRERVLAYLMAPLDRAEAEGIGRVGLGRRAA